MFAGLAEVDTSYTLRWHWQVPHSPERVWRAITTPGEASEWMSAAVELEPRVAGRFLVDFGKDHDAKDGVVVEVVPGELLVHTWPMRAGEGEPGRVVTLIRWLVEPEGAGSAITFSHSGLTRPMAQGLGGGWLGFLEQFLALLDERPFVADADYDSKIAPALTKWKHAFDRAKATTPRP